MRFRETLRTLRSIPRASRGVRSGRIRLKLEALEDRTLLASNPIVAENMLPGSPASEWDVSGVGDTSLQGFATDISVDHGQTISFKINDTSQVSYHIDIYRMGYYGGLGARKVATISSAATLRQAQPAGLTNSATGLLDCGNWAVSATWAVPASATSGIYFAKLISDDTGGASHIPFIVRDDEGHSDLLYQTSDTTWQAYNNYGGNSLYEGSSSFGDRAVAVSYNRPWNTRATTGGLGASNWFFWAEYPMVRWMEENGYNVSYFTDVDSDRHGAEILDHKVFMSSGHDEYWSGGQRTNVEAARDAGVDLAFFSGNESFWKTRWETSIDGSGTPYRTLVCYKETHADAKIDPLATVWTGSWRDPRFSPPADGGRPENSLSGTIFTVNRGQGGDFGTAIQVPAVDSKLRFWRNTSVATLGAGQTATLANGTLGYEWDEDLDNGSRPAGLIDLSSTTEDVPERILDYGNVFGPGTATHSLTLYRADSGALVFATGTVQWSFGLDSKHDGPASVPDVRMQQATVNLFADMGVQPGTIQPGLVAATASTDTARPTSVITNLVAGTSLQSGVPITISGTANDTGGGIVAAVEISTDGGLTWHRATGRNSWTYNWTPTTGGATNIRTRAVDDSANRELPAAGIPVTVSAPSSLWNGSVTPLVPSENDTSPVEVGLKFTSDVAGSIAGVRFYKGVSNTGLHVAHLWSGTGTLLATANFGNESASGWQQVSFSTPVAIAANTTYIVSYFAPVGEYAVNVNYFSSSGFDSAPLHAPSSSAGGGNGVYHYGSSGGFPTDTYNGSNYWVDPLFTAATPTGTTPSGLVAAFGFNEGSGSTAADGSGHGLNGVLSNATWSTAGRFGDALAFNGTNALVTVNDNNLLDLTNGMTLEAWVNPSTLNGWTTAILKERSGGLAYSLYASDAAGRPPAGYIDQSGADTSVVGTSALALRTWTHLAMTYDGSAMRLYVNGTLVQTRSLTGNILTSTNALRIGGNAIWGEYFNGLIDEVRVYSRALSTSEIQADMNTPIGGGAGGLMVQGGPAGSPVSSPSLTPEALAPLVVEAAARWQAALPPGTDLSALANTPIRVVDLPGSELGWMGEDGTIWIDRDAAGYGWFLDPTPGDDREFLLGGDQGEQGRIDLLTVLMHEIGHVLGFSHEANGIMAESLGPGLRSDPGSAQAHDDALAALTRAGQEPEGRTPTDEPTLTQLAAEMIQAQAKRLVSCQMAPGHDASLSSARPNFGSMGLIRGDRIGAV